MWEPPSSTSTMPTETRMPASSPAAMALATLSSEPNSAWNPSQLVLSSCRPARFRSATNRSAFSAVRAHQAFVTTRVIRSRSSAKAMARSRRSLRRVGSPPVKTTPAAVGKLAICVMYEKTSSSSMGNFVRGELPTEQ